MAAKDRPPMPKVKRQTVNTKYQTHQRGFSKSMPRLVFMIFMNYILISKI